MSTLGPAAELRRAARLMREQHGPEHKRHAMWAAMADWLDATADWADENEGRIMLHALEPGALAVARAYLAEPPPTQRDPSGAPEEEA